MTIDQRRLRDAILRTDLGSFLRTAFPLIVAGEPLRWNWHLDAICYHLERVRSGEITRLIIEVPPRSLKSIAASVVFPAFCLGRDPTRKIITASYSADLAIKHANDSRALMRTDMYRALFPGTVIGNGKDTETEFHTTARGYRYSTSPGGTLTGRGGDLLILDDIMNAREAASDAKRDAVINWYANTAFSRLDDKVTGAIVVVMQRLHQNDLAGHLRDQGGWTVLSLPAIADEPQSIPIGNQRVITRSIGDVLHPEREPQSALEHLRSTLGGYNFSAQYQQRPIPLEGELIKWRWFKRFEREPSGHSNTIVQSWDIGMKAGAGNDYSVCTTWVRHGNDHYLIDIVRDRWDFPYLKWAVVELARKYRANTILIEDKVTGTALIQQLTQERLVGVPNPIGCTPHADKVSRLIAESPTIEAGHVLLPERADWLEPLRSETSQFPNGQHDDQIDSISQYLNWARLSSGPTFGLARIVGR
jgi:predicted phage terminase large subunit-like protein